MGIAILSNIKARLKGNLAVGKEAERQAQHISCKLETEIRFGKLRGWAYNIHNPDERLTVQLCCDGEVLNETVSCLPRPDLCHAIPTPFDYGFAFSVPVVDCAKAPVTFSLRVAEYPDAQVKNGVVTLTMSNKDSVVRGSSDKQLAGRFINGWAVEAATGQGGRRLVIMIDGNFLTEVIADAPRHDIAKAGLGEVNCGFRVRLPKYFFNGNSHVVTVLDSMTRLVLNNTGMRFSAADIKGGLERERSRLAAEMYESYCRHFKGKMA